MRETVRGSASRRFFLAWVVVAAGGGLMTGGVARSSPEAASPSPRVAVVGPSDPTGAREDLFGRSYVYTVGGVSTMVGPSNPMGDPALGAPEPMAPSYPPPPGDFAPAAPSNTPDIPLGVVGNFNFDEPLVRANPTNPLNVVVTSHRGMRPSVDGGVTYLPTITYPATLGPSNGDTGTAFDSLGRFFWANLVVANDGDLQILQANPANGAVVNGPINVQTASGDAIPGFDDKEFLAADEYPPSGFTDNLYLVWTKFGANTTVYTSRSTNQGVAWSTPLALSVPAEGFPWPSDIAVAPNGDVYAAYHSGGDTGAVGDTWVLRSTDGGVTFPQKVRAFLPGQSDVTFNVKSAVGSIPGLQFWMQGSAQPWLLPDPVRPGNVYVVSNDDPDNVHGNGDDADVVLARSADDGATWAVTTIPDGSGGALQVFPFAAIDQLGNLAVAWYDTRRGLTNGFGRLLLDVFATYSLDGGVTWATPFMVNDPNNPFDPDFPSNQRRYPEPQTTPCAKTVGSTETCRIGEYMGIDIDRGRVYVTWEGNAFDAGGNVTGDQQWTDSFDIANLGVTKSDGTTVAIPGGTTTYTIVASNAGPGPAPGTVVTDTFPAVCTSVSWTCGGAGGGTCPAAGMGNLATAVDLPAGGSVTFSATCSINPAATGSLSNTVTVTPGPGVDDTSAGNDSATDLDTLTPQADISVTKTADPTAVDVGDPVTFTIVVANAGPSNAPGVTVQDLFPVGFQANLVWTCGGTGGGICTVAGNGDIVDIVDLPAGASVTYVATCDAFSPEDADLTNTASATLPAGVTDPDPSDQEGSATVSVNAFAIQEIPTLDRSALAVLVLLLGIAGFLVLRRLR